MVFIDLITTSKILASKNILKMGHPLLREIARSVPPASVPSSTVQEVILDMIDTLEETGGIGLAAPQIGESLRIVIIKIPEGSNSYGELKGIPLSVFINPSITKIGQEEEAHWEGCLSVPGLRGLVSRPQHLKLNYLTVDQEQKEIEVKGFLATVLQHECDHLDGILYIDRLVDSTQLSFESEFAEFIAN